MNTLSIPRCGFAMAATVATTWRWANVSATSGLRSPVGGDVMSTSTHTDDRRIHLYERLAPVYDSMHRRWLRFSGGEAQAALEAAVRTAVTPNSVILDAGCGTGRFSRALLSEGVSVDQVILLDASRSMLDACTDIPARQVLGRLEALPFADGAFDVVVCAWAIETVPKPERALDELCRVLRPGGLLCLAFCADRPTRGVVDRVTRELLRRRGTGNFLNPAEVVSTLKRSMRCDVRIVPVAGPAAMIMARRATTTALAPYPHQSSELIACVEIDSIGKSH